MPNIASILKAEISRVARKEVRAEIETLRKSSSQHRSALASLRRQVDGLEKQLRQLQKKAVAPGVAPGGLAQDPNPGDTPRRFSATRLAAHRQKVELSAASYGQLMGMSGQTIYNWEQGKSRPDAQQVRQLAELKTLTRSALMERVAAASGN